MEPNNPNQNNQPANQIISDNVSQLQPPQPPASQPPSTPIPLESNRKMSSKKIALIIMFVLFAMALATVGIIAMQQYSNSNSQPVESQPIQYVTTVPPTIPPTTSQQQVDSEVSLLTAECSEFPDMLESCTKYTCQFTHPITEEKMTREIIGIVNNTCSYTEQMPNNGLMTCSYTDSMRSAVTAYYRNIVNAESYGSDTSIKFSPKGSETTSTYTINGVVVDNPLEEALTTGACVISG